MKRDEQMEQKKVIEPFCCYICKGVFPTLLSVKLSKWISQPPFELLIKPDDEGLRKFREETEYKKRFICFDCSNKFEFAPQCITGFMKRGGDIFRVSISQKPVVYDRDRWIKSIW